MENNRFRILKTDYGCDIILSDGKEVRMPCEFTAYRIVSLRNYPVTYCYVISNLVYECQYNAVSAGSDTYLPMSKKEILDLINKFKLESRYVSWKAYKYKIANEKLLKMMLKYRWVVKVNGQYIVNGSKLSNCYNFVVQDR